MSINFILDSANLTDCVPSHTVGRTREAAHAFSSEFSNLEILRFRPILISADFRIYGTPVAASTMIKDTLSHISDQIRQIHFDLCFIPDPNHASIMHGFPFQLVQEAAHRFPNLHCVVFSVAHPHDVPFTSLPALKDNIRESLSELEQQGKLICQ